MRKRKINRLDELAHWATAIVLTKIQPWIRVNGGWVSSTKIIGMYLVYMVVIIDIVISEIQPWIRVNGGWISRTKIIGYI